MQSTVSAIVRPFASVSITTRTKIAIHEHVRKIAMLFGIERRHFNVSEVIHVKRHLQKNRARPISYMTC